MEGSSRGKEKALAFRIAKTNPKARFGATQGKGYIIQAPVWREEEELQKRNYAGEK